MFAVPTQYAVTAVSFATTQKRPFSDINFAYHSPFELKATW